MHKYTQVAKGWQPTVVTSSTLRRNTAAPSEVLAREFDKLVDCWQAGECPNFVVTPDRASLPRLLPDQLDAAARRFSSSTSSTIDGWHPRHFALLTRPGLSVLGMLLQSCEAAGFFPE